MGWEDVLTALARDDVCSRGCESWARPEADVISLLRLHRLAQVHSTHPRTVAPVTHDNRCINSYPYTHSHPITFLRRRIAHHPSLPHLSDSCSAGPLKHRLSHYITRDKHVEQLPAIRRESLWPGRGRLWRCQQPIWQHRVWVVEPIWWRRKHHNCAHMRPRLT